MTSKEAVNLLKARYKLIDAKTYRGMIAAIEKDLEVIEILKSKKVHIASVCDAHSFAEYNEYIHNELTEKEFELIREWLERKE